MHGETRTQRWVRRLAEGGSRPATALLIPASADGRGPVKTCRGGSVGQALGADAPRQVSANDYREARLRGGRSARMPIPCVTRGMRRGHLRPRSRSLRPHARKQSDPPRKGDLIETDSGFREQPLPRSPARTPSRSPSASGQVPRFAACRGPRTVPSRARSAESWRSGHRRSRRSATRPRSLPVPTPSGLTRAGRTSCWPQPLRTAGAPC